MEKLKETETFRKQSIAKLRDAQVGPKEELDFYDILPKANDKPSVYQAKLKASKMYLQNLENKSSKKLSGSAVTEKEYEDLKKGMKKGGMTKGQKKIRTVMREFKAKKLKSSSGQKVTNPKQAIAIALSEAGQSKKMKKAKGGSFITKGGDYIKDLL